MDEAERCHEIAYIAYGVLLAHGTVEEVIAGSHLATYTVSARNGEGLAKLAEELSERPGVDMVAPFGTSLHVSGRDEAALEAAIAPYRERAGSDLDPFATLRSRTSSSISWARPRTISNERAGCRERAAPAFVA